ncbi:sensor domain-containing protein [Amycolatopsis sp., V23-08]|uniref:Sensor domain-containing protein n=1 Tax=Amycolatopsis heterodermiae TaxID=3110235 RepID=A0ABU5R9J6_9PSEU|nr:sensor domain-containing protein [Amycolatopsis sp., V23-08]MEA5362314.1 sensor domain-containing protein [Amycolatopsis sp., V23-08]
MTLTDRRADRDFLGRHLRQLFLDSRYLLLGAPLSLVAFTVAVTGISLGAVVVPILAATLYACRRLAAFERKRVEPVLGRSLPGPGYRPAPADAGTLRRWSAPLADPQCWLDFAYAVVRSIPALLAFGVALTWWTGALVGLASPVHLRSLSIEGSSVGDLLLGRGSFASPWFDFAVGAVMLLTLVPVVRAVAWLDASIARVLLRAVPDVA